MRGLDPKDAEAIDRLVLQLIQDAYCDLAAAMQNLAPDAAGAMFHSLEHRIADALFRISFAKTEGPSSNTIALGVGLAICSIMDRAHGRVLEARAA